MVVSRNNIILSGYFKNFCIVFSVPEYAREDGFGSREIEATNNSLRMKFSARPLSWLALDADFDLSPRIFISLPVINGKSPAYVRFYIRAL